MADESEVGKKYWMTLEERDGEAGRQPSEPETLSDSAASLLEKASRLKVDRAGFLKLAGFSFAGAALSGCASRAAHKAIPYLVQPEEVTPGEATWYATACGACPAGCGALAKNRAGRPIKLEGNPGHPLNRGGLCALGQASLLGLYDSHRLKGPRVGGKDTDWTSLDRAVLEELGRLRSKGGSVRLLSRGVTSPTLRGRMEAFLSGFKDARLVEYDPLSVSSLSAAYETTHGTRLLPRFRFDKADWIVSFGADFLGTWISPVEFQGQWAYGRRLEGGETRFSRHLQVESTLSLTGSKADERWVASPGGVVLVLAHLARLLGAPLEGLAACPAPEPKMRALARGLEGRRGRSLVVCGDNQPEAQVLCAWINHRLGNEGTTLDLKRASLQARGDDKALAVLLKEMREGKVSALLIHDANPVYELPEGPALAGEMGRVPLVLSFAGSLDETSSLARFVCPEPHWLESWGDSEPVEGLLGLRQPAVRPWRDSRPALESLALWSGHPAGALDQLRARWHREVHPHAGGGASFESFWNKTLREGWVETGGGGTPGAFRQPDFAALSRSMPGGDKGLELLLYPTVGLRDGRHAGNPWLQEMPDPVTKISWDNHASLAPDTARALGLDEGDLARLELADGTALELPVHLQPGQHGSCVAVSLGYGAQASRRFAHVGPRWLLEGTSVGPDGLVGGNAFPLLGRDGAGLSFRRAGLKVAGTGGRRPMACAQVWQTLSLPANLAPEGGALQPFLREMTLAHYLTDHSKPRPEEDASLYSPRRFPGHRWAMAVDLSACTGCSGCVLGCQVENNIPVVGREEMRRGRGMHWLRVDRYYSGSTEDLEVAFQPMFCQQCGKAPCDPVCPVAATATSEEGLCQQVYNRCVGTRYCEVNCPYKVRRFNWFDYPHEDPTQNLALNPDVTVRTRGVMEKCSFCVQRILGAKDLAKREGRELKDGDIRTACQQSCPSGAIVFGDLDDPDSRISRMRRDGRAFRVLAELGVEPAVTYLSLVRNRA